MLAHPGQVDIQILGKSKLTEILVKVMEIKEILEELNHLGLVKVK